ncbi:hypothetical protein [Caballeronia sp. RCC_10]|uniref:hypothetical protein n=1 Tax=Caballeronia sp. RCC_10 TaxID=3239227 RepID=UPI003525003C
MKRDWQCALLLGIGAVAIGVALPCAATGEKDATPPIQFSGTNVTRTNAIIFAVDIQRNSMTLLEETGEPVDVVVDRSLGDVSELHIGDTVAVTSSRALLMRADRLRSSEIREQIDEEFSTGSPFVSSMSVHRVEAVTTVVGIDLRKTQLTLRGPTRTVVLQESSRSLLDG